jgi:hypothetical protein
MIDMQTYTQWKGKVNDLVLGCIDIRVDDLPDCPYHDWYDKGVDPWLAAARAVRAVLDGENYDY